jgi:YD repeat-containing protein
LSRKTAVSNLAIQANPLVQQTYTPDGLVASLIVARANTTFNTTGLAYDGFDRLGTMTYPDASTQVLAYDADGNVLTRQTRASQTITYTYDTLNRLSTKAAPSEASVTYGYDLTGRLLGASDNSASRKRRKWSGRSALRHFYYVELSNKINCFLVCEILLLDDLLDVFVSPGFLDTFRTICLSPKPELLAFFEILRRNSF